MLKTIVAVILVCLLADAVSDILYAIADAIRFQTEEKRRQSKLISDDTK